MSTSQPKQVEEHFRQTGKFKPISDRFHPKNDSSFLIQHFEHIQMEAIISNNENAHLYRIYLQEGHRHYAQSAIKQLLLSALTMVERSNGLGQQAEVFQSAGGLLVERLSSSIHSYCVSSLDFNCVMVKVARCQNKYILEMYPVQCEQQHEQDFSEQVAVKARNDLQTIYLLHKNKSIFIAKTLTKNYPVMDLTQHYLESSTIDIEKQSLTVNSLSTKMVGMKFQNQSLIVSNEPLLIHIPNKYIFQRILYKINRVKYGKYLVCSEQTEGKQSLQLQGKKQNKTTPDKNKSKHQPNKVSMLSTMAVDDQQQQKKTIKLITQPRHLKISQRVATNPKESNLVPSENDYPVSVKDEKEKENPYLDQFQNLLYEDQGEEKQLTLNDSFQQFQKKEQSEKNMQIIKELARRKEKETEEKKMLDGLKQKLKSLIAEEKELINKNLKLKSDIKRLKQQEPNDQNREIEDIKQKLAELKLQEHHLIEELADIKKNNCIEVLVCGEPPTNSSQSQRGKDKMLFHSINNLPVTSNFNPLTTSVRSNTGASKFPQNPTLPQGSIGFKATRPNFLNPPLNNPMGFPNGPTQSFIQPCIAQQSIPYSQSKPVQGVMNSDYMGYQTRQNMQYQQQQQGPVPFTSAIFSANGRIGMNTMGGKKPSVQVFPTYNNKN